MAGTEIAELKKGQVALKDMKPKDQVKHLLDQNKLAIHAAIPKHMNPERLLKVAQTAITSTPALLECYVPTLLGGIIQCAQMGLEPNTVLGHAYLIPYRNKKKNRQDAQVIIGYKGLIDLARRSGNVTSIAAHAVRKGDIFEFEYGLTEKLRHIPSEAGGGEITHFYAVAHMKDGGHAFEVLTRKQVEKIRDGGNRNPVWSEHFEEMGRKTAIRRLAKFLPLSVELATGMAQDGQAAPELEMDGSLTADFTVVDEDEGLKGGEDATGNDTGVARDTTGGTEHAEPADNAGDSSDGGAGRLHAQERDVAERTAGGGAESSKASQNPSSPTSPPPADVIAKIRSLKTLDALDDYMSIFDGPAYSAAERQSIQKAYQDRRELIEDPKGGRKGLE